MNQEKLPTLDWCDKYGHLFGGKTIWVYKQCEVDPVLREIQEKYIRDTVENSQHIPKEEGRIMVKEIQRTIAVCPDAIDIMEWLFAQNGVQVERNRYKEPDKNGHYYNSRGKDGSNHWKCYQANSWIEALQRAVTLVEKK